ncbi:uncharacterized protein LAESUDRAFT_164932 [Laetiporus sulphureus 93-53]|uniref:Uncharacterized protein n=1 Tax=Laetiporus sulphureus 93-53 TaxID=1314785 RepID=A0A165HQK0_9APHY|nr:uncharacterized protein LAESUDRAFT_164932 [Laetiporus sulphureus 93-53]KZT12054.1 hypothetical protein LAESUDRAFT_164932 [Laetiporus sulphureus 93-53]
MVMPAGGCGCCALHALFQQLTHLSASKGSLTVLNCMASSCNFDTRYHSPSDADCIGLHLTPAEARICESFSHAQL